MRLRGRRVGAEDQRLQASAVGLVGRISLFARISSTTIAVRSDSLRHGCRVIAIPSRIGVA
ncbi:hypothetical protein WI29_17930 [Burkholderia ubonensis]|nr:hypothetical protein WI31_03600 [Burkholderia ubonensis]KUZ17408.1 hypothetical protein WI29_17930 [Burkholderia ubonensis]KUZ31184.1 hypothetical protein WI32_00955 [Burkholderia ubonensis]KUZ37956.1 hypothetical protein WI30_04715 [Burkholderia ubonensis]KUZ39956.1 hypothetical protein WI33_34430 [Burkholderia ubonensis]